MQCFESIHMVLIQGLFQMPHCPDIFLNPFNQIYSLSFRPHSPALSPRPLAYSVLVALKAISPQLVCQFLEGKTVSSLIYSLYDLPHTQTQCLTCKIYNLIIHWIGFWNSPLWNHYWFSPFNKYSFISRIIISTIFLGKFVRSGWWAQLVRALC